MQSCTLFNNSCNLAFDLLTNAIMYNQIYKITIPGIAENKNNSNNKNNQI